MVAFKFIDSADYFIKFQGKTLKRSNLPQKNFEDLKGYDKAYFFEKGVHVFKSIKE